MMSSSNSWLTHFHVETLVCLEDIQTLQKIMLATKKQEITDFTDCILGLAKTVQSQYLMKRTLYMVPTDKSHIRVSRNLEVDVMTYRLTPKTCHAPVQFRLNLKLFETLDQIVSRVPQRTLIDSEDPMSDVLGACVCLYALWMRARVSREWEIYMEQDGQVQSAELIDLAP